MYSLTKLSSFCELKSARANDPSASSSFQYLWVVSSLPVETLIINYNTNETQKIKGTIGVPQNSASTVL